MTLALIILIAADVVYGEQPPIQPCDERAYLSFHEAIPNPPSVMSGWRDFVGPRPMNVALPEAGTAAITYEQWTKEPMRRRGQ